MALLVITALTAALAAGFAGIAAEYTTNAAQRGQNRAYNLAQTGLEQFMVLRSQKNWCTNCVDDPAVADSEWTRISLPGGYADVVAVKVRPTDRHVERPVFHSIARRRYVGQAQWSGQRHQRRADRGRSTRRGILRR